MHMFGNCSGSPTSVRMYAHTIGHLLSKYLGSSAEDASWPTLSATVPVFIPRSAVRTYITHLCMRTYTRERNWIFFCNSWLFARRNFSASNSSDGGDLPIRMGGQKRDDFQKEALARVLRQNRISIVAILYTGWGWFALLFYGGASILSAMMRVPRR